MARANHASNASAPDSARIVVEITATVERDLKRLALFLELRLQYAARVINGSTGVHHLPLSRAKELQQHVDACRTRGPSNDVPRGTAVAYTALERRLRKALRDECQRWSWRDPGAAEVQRRMDEESALIGVGEVCLYFSSDDDEYGVPTRVVAGFGVHFVVHDNGRFIRHDGKLGDYLPGYGVSFDGDPAVYVVPAGKLTRNDCKPAHIRVVT